MPDEEPEDAVTAIGWALESDEELVDVDRADDDADDVVGDVCSEQAARTTVRRPMERIMYFISESYSSVKEEVAPSSRGAIHCSHADIR